MFRSVITNRAHDIHLWEADRSALNLLGDLGKCDRPQRLPVLLQALRREEYGRR